MRRSLVAASILSCSIFSCVHAQPGGAAKAPLAPAPASRVPGGEVAASAGYYRMPAIHGDTVVFVSEGDLWRVPVTGGRATRLTSHAGVEQFPAISPDGTTLVFAGAYEGPLEVYTMPMTGGLPTRRTWGERRITFVGWKGNDTVLFSTMAESNVPHSRTVMLRLSDDARTPIPLDECDDATFLDDGSSLVFTRLDFQGSHTDRYKGGSAQNLWRFTLPAPGAKGEEAVPLTADFAGTSKRPMWWNGRVYFTSDRDGRMNIWSMKQDGGDLQQHTRHADADIGSTSLHNGRIVYQLGADLWLLDVAAGKSGLVPVTLDSDLDQTRERWVEKPLDYATSTGLSPDGDRLVLTARGRVFVLPAKQGRVVDVDKREGVRYRDARFMPDGKSLVALSDESGEIELTTLPANGVGDPTRLTTDGDTVRWQTRPSPDGKRIAHTDKMQRLWVLEVESKTNTLVEENPVGDIDGLSWSPDSRWLAYQALADNTYTRIKLWDSTDKATLVATSNRYDSYAPRWSKDGKWLYFLSDRTFSSVVGSPWGPRAPEPFFDKPSRIYQIALKKGERSPFAPDDEVYAAQKKAEDEKKKKEEDEKKEQQKKEEDKDKPPQDPASQDEPAKPQEQPAPASDAPAKDDKPDDEKKKDEKAEEVKVEIDADGLMDRIDVLFVPAGNYTNLMVGDGVIFFESYNAAEFNKRTLSAFKVTNKDPEVKKVADGIAFSQLSQDRKKLLVKKGDSLHVIDAEVSEAKLDKPVDLSGWSLSIIPRDEWRQMYTEAWRLLRDYFYDKGMHGVDWRAVLDKYRPSVDRVRDRRELSDVLTALTGELSALHHFVSGGDIRSGKDDVGVAALGASLERDAAANGWRVKEIYAADPDEPWLRSPLAQPEANVGVGDVIESINGVATVNLPHPERLLRKQAGRQVLLNVRPAAGGEPRDVIVKPFSGGEEASLRYRQWEVERRKTVEELGDGQIGYVHLRAMGTGDIGDFARDYYPNFTRKGLIIDVRENGGGNIDSWVLSRLMRKAWMYWSQHTGYSPTWNMQYAFRGHMVVLCNEGTGSDGEAFTEGFKRLGLGKVIGTRTWGGEIWLSASNFLVDNGVATAGEFGVYGPEGTWLIEGHGVDPDIVVDNPLHATYLGEDAQLKAAVDHLQQLIRDKPVEIPPVPKGPDKGFKK